MRAVRRTTWGVFLAVGGAINVLLAAAYFLLGTLGSWDLLVEEMTGLSASTVAWIGLFGGGIASFLGYLMLRGNKSLDNPSRESQLGRNALKPKLARENRFEISAHLWMAILLISPVAAIWWNSGAAWGAAVATLVAAAVGVYWVAFAIRQRRHGKSAGTADRQPAADDSEHWRRLSWKVVGISASLIVLNLIGAAVILTSDLPKSLLTFSVFQGAMLAAAFMLLIWVRHRNRTMRLQTDSP